MLVAVFVVDAETFGESVGFRQQDCDTSLGIAANRNFTARWETAAKGTWHKDVRPVHIHAISETAQSLTVHACSQQGNSYLVVVCPVKRPSWVIGDAVHFPRIW